jgi:signal transduction histidine kinase
MRSNPKNVLVVDRGQPAHKYQQELLKAQNLEEITAVLRRISQELISIHAFQLIAYDHSSGTLSVIAEWDEGTAPFGSGFNGSCDGWESCLAALVPSQEGLTPCRCSTGTQTACPRYCLPLVLNEQISILLHLYLSSTVDLVPFHLSLLEELAPLIARSYQALLQKQEVDRLVEAAHQEKREIARYLHDTLSHSLAYLRLKLELLSGQSMDQKHCQEVVHLGSMVDQCYEDVRGLLTHLFDEGDDESQIWFIDYIQKLRESVNFQINFTVNGQPQDLSQGIQRSVNHILRELFHNVEKHASASSVNVSINWDAETIHLKVADNGCGFNPADVLQRKGHYGLRIIREYVEDGQGKLVVSSTPGSGTAISIQLPVQT